MEVSTDFCVHLQRKKMPEFVSTIFPLSEGRKGTHPLCIPIACYFQPVAGLSSCASLTCSFHL